MGDRTRVDLNADVAESFGRWQLGDDAGIIPMLSSANIACGFHAGDPLTIRTAVALATRQGVRIGAQVSYSDLVGFGRREMEVAPEVLIADVLYQIAALDGLCRVAGSKVSYVKPHGALYHRTLRDDRHAGALVAAISAYDKTLPVLTMSEGVLARLGVEHGLRIVSEGFCDRCYRDDGSLVPRSQDGAVMTDEDVIVAQALRLVRSGSIESLCLHGDTPGAPTLAQAVRLALEKAGIRVVPFT